jgi:hypothetical protein
VESQLQEIQEAQEAVVRLELLERVAREQAAKDLPAEVGLPALHSLMVPAVVPVKLGAAAQVRSQALAEMALLPALPERQ